MFVNPRTRRPWSKSALYREFQKAGISRPTHYLQGEFVRLALQASEDPHWIAAQLGYKHYRSFERRYGKIRPHEKRSEKRTRGGLYQAYPANLYDGHRLSVLLRTGTAPGDTVRKVGMVVDEAPSPTWWPKWWQTPAAWL